MSIIVNRNIVFLDSNQFYKGKLDNHASHLNNEDFKHLLSEFPIDKLELLKGKDAYPYEWVDSYEKFNYQELPPKECFYSSVNDGKRDNNNGPISNEKYLHLQNIWNTFILIMQRFSYSLSKKRCIIISGCICKIYFYFFKKL